MSNSDCLRGNHPEHHEYLSEHPKGCFFCVSFNLILPCCAQGEASKQYLAVHPLCVLCAAEGRYSKATVVDHINLTEGTESYSGIGVIASAV